MVGVTTGEAAKSKGDFIRGVIRARRKAVEYMYSNPKESAEIIAKAYDLEVARRRIDREQPARLREERRRALLGPGDIRIDTMDNMIRAQKIVGALKGDADWSKLIDESFLPDDLKTKKK